MVTDTKLLESALAWKLDYLETNIGDGDFSVYTSDTERFLYYDEQKVSVVENFTEPTKRVEMKFPEFAAKVRNYKAGDKRFVASTSVIMWIYILFRCQCYVMLYIGRLPSKVYCGIMEITIKNI